MEKRKVSAKENQPGTTKTAIGRQEKDIDDLVHDEAAATNSDQSEEDLDDKVHRIQRQESSHIAQPNTGMEDPDDLVHSTTEED